MKFSEMSNQELFFKALDKAGYIDVEPNEENVRQCFLDYIDTGEWSNVYYEDNIPYSDNGEEIDIREMAIGLIRLR